MFYKSFGERGCFLVEWWVGFGVYFCVRYYSVYIFCFFLYSVFSKVYKGYGIVFCGFVSYLEGSERVYGGRAGIVEGWGEFFSGNGKEVRGKLKVVEWWEKRYN